METKTPESITPSITKDDLPNASKESNTTNSLTVCNPGKSVRLKHEIFFFARHLLIQLQMQSKRIAGTALETSISEYDLQVPSISDCSIELKKVGQSNSNYSIQSLKSVTSLESHGDDDASEFMRRFVDILFTDSSQLTQELKSEFGNKSQVRASCQLKFYSFSYRKLSKTPVSISQTESGRFWFARFVSAQRSHSKRVIETSFYSLIQHFAIILFECKENDDFAPAKVLMNMCFTYFYEGIQKIIRFFC